MNDVLKELDSTHDIEFYKQNIGGYKHLTKAAQDITLSPKRTLNGWVILHRPLKQEHGSVPLYETLDLLRSKDVPITVVSNSHPFTVDSVISSLKTI